MAGERKVWRCLPVFLDGYQVGTAANKFDIKLARDRLPFSCMSDEGPGSDKGNWTASLAMEGYGKESEGKLLERLGQDEEDDTSFAIGLEADTRLSPYAVPGEPALFGLYRTFGVDMPAEAGQIKRFSASFEPGDGHHPFVGVVLYTSMANVPAPLGDGDEITSIPQELGELDDTNYLAVTVHCTKITSSGTITALVEVQSDVDGTFTTPVTQYEFDLFTNDPTPGVGEVTGPKSQSVIIETPVPGETFWAVKVTVADTDTDGEVEVFVAAALVAR